MNNQNNDQGRQQGSSNIGQQSGSGTQQSGQELTGQQNQQDQTRGQQGQQGQQGAQQAGQQQQGGGSGSSGRIRAWTGTFGSSSTRFHDQSPRSRLPLVWRAAARWSSRKRP